MLSKNVKLVDNRVQAFLALDCGILQVRTFECKKSLYTVINKFYIFCQPAGSVSLRIGDHSLLTRLRVLYYIIFRIKHVKYGGVGPSGYISIKNILIDPESCRVVAGYAFEI